MREVEVSAFVLARPPVIHRVLTPETVVTAEGTFEVAAVEEEDGSPVVVAAAPGVTVPLRFRESEAGLAYTAAGEAGPSAHLDTEIDVKPERNRPGVPTRPPGSLHVPPPLADRAAAA